MKSSVLYRNLLAYQVYGANTEVGKTIFSTILSRAFAAKSRKTWYLKPVSTGPDDEADDGHLKRFAKETNTKCLFQFGEAVSPHIAAAGEPPRDSIIVEGVVRYLNECAAHGPGTVLVETAGGVHSPAPSGTSQADLYRPLRLPIFMVADSKLGGISSTISAFESLHLRGYDLDSLLVFENQKYQNHEYLSEYFTKKRIQTVAIPPPPKRLDNANEELESMNEYYKTMSTSDQVQELIEGAMFRHRRRLGDLKALPEKAVDTIWYPFTQHKDLSKDKVITIDSAYGDFFQTYSNNGKDNLLQPTFDASASWWTQGLGHGSPDLSLAASYAAGRYGHVMFAGAVHDPAISLAEKLLGNLENPRLAKVFYSDNGSTGMEVAIKMALHASAKRYNYGREGQANIGIIGLKGSYHGDTIGTMDASEPCTFNENVHWYEGKGYWFEFPKVMMKKGVWVVEAPAGMEHEFGATEEFSHLAEIFDGKRDESERKRTYEKYILSELMRLTKEEKRQFGALVMEPILLGAGGMLFCDPLFQRTLASTIRANPQLFTSNNVTAPTSPDTWTGLPVIHDEVFTGLYRLGLFTPSAALKVHPDIVVHAKLLTGGLLPLCTTTASNAIYESFLGDTKAEALLHGHSYTAHAIGCEVANKSLDTMLALDVRGGVEKYQAYKEDWAVPSTSVGVLRDEQWSPWSCWSQSFIKRLSHNEDIESVIALGTVLAVALRDAEGAGYSSDAAVGLQKRLMGAQDQEAGFNVHSRTLGNVVYVMASLVSEKKDLMRLEEMLVELIEGDVENVQKEDVEVGASKESR